jgi:NAD(P)-dependent dehydrogenase (short-subunit alcohol dehydrogenase family)
VVTGASRGVGRGIALALGQEGATVYVTGRSVSGRPTTDDLPGTIDETAAEVTARGGSGHPIRTDHTVESEVEALFERVGQEHGRLDLLVNNAWGGYEGEDYTFDAPFWEQPLWRLDRMLAAGVRATMLTSSLAVPLMLPQRRGLIVTTSLDAGPHDWSLDRRGPISVPYETAKTAINRMMLGMAHNLRPFGVAAVTVAPGWTRTERVLRDHPPGPHELGETQSVEYVGRAVAALAADRDAMQKSGRILKAVDLAREYGFTDLGD